MNDTAKPEDLMIDPANAAAIEAVRQGYLEARDRATAPDQKFHFHMMAEMSVPFNRALFTHGMTLEPEKQYTAILHMAAKFVGEALMNCAEEGAPINWPALGLQFAGLVQSSTQTAKYVSSLEIKVG